MYWHDDTSLHPPIGTLMWHLHHEELAERLTEPLINRLDYIRNEKSKYESTEQIHLRLSLIDVVKNPPAELIEAEDAYDKAKDAYDKVWHAYYKARDAYYKAWHAYNKAGNAYNKALDAYNKAGNAYSNARDAYIKAEDAYNKALKSRELESLHKIEHPNCPWNGNSIFK